MNDLVTLRIPVRLVPALAWLALAVPALLALATPVRAQALDDELPADLPAWVHDVGARRTPDADRTCAVTDYGVRPDPGTSSTRGIQQAIDACAEAGGGVVTFAPGAYLTGALFVKSDVHLRIDEGVTLYGSHDDADYPVRPTRVAGIEMDWPVGLINVDGQTNVRISGGGTIDGRGEKWWDLYWDMRRNDYEPRGLRWAVDYDARRVRLMVVSNSSDITIQDLHLKRSGFWTVHVLYSEHVTVNGLTISDNQGPSTDGVNIDSSRWALVADNDIDNNDDTICLKAGRDADGLRVDRPTEYVLIRDNLSRRGGGVVSFGSETSGGIRHIVAWRNRGVGTGEGIRFKSAKTRGGYVRDVLIRDLAMVDVPRPITFTLDWNPSYSYASLPEDAGDVPEHWVTLTTPVEPPERGLTEIRDVAIEDVRAVGAEWAFSASGLPEMPIADVTLERVTIIAGEAGSIAHARDWTLRDVTVATPSGTALTMTDVENVDRPRVRALAARPSQDAPPRLPPPDSILADLRLANRYFMEKWPDPGEIIVTNIPRPSNIWTRAVYYEGLMALYGVEPRAELKDEYYQYALDWAESHDWDLREGQTYTRNADNQAAGQTYIDLYEIDPQPERIRAIQASIDSMMATDKIDDWDWIDAIQMAMPVFAKLGVLRDEPAYFQRMYEMYRFSRDAHGDKGLYNPEDGLWWRDADYDPPHTSPLTEDVYWSRGNGWVFMALVRVLDSIPEDAPGYDLYIEDLRSMAEALRRIQRADGFWNASLHDPSHFGGPETSGTAMFAYGMAWGINQGLLDGETYRPVVARAWQALSEEALHDDGFLGYVQSTGKDPAAGQPVTYDRAPDFEDYGLGAFLLAGAEVYELGRRDAEGRGETQRVRNPAKE